MLVILRQIVIVDAQKQTNRISVMLHWSPPIWLHVFCVAPGPISNLSLTSTNNALDATWSPPNSSFSSFTVKLYVNESTAGYTTGIKDFNVSFHNLKNGANYTVEVRAVSGIFESSAVNASIFTRESLLHFSVFVCLVFKTNGCWFKTSPYSEKRKSMEAIYGRQSSEDEVICMSLTWLQNSDTALYNFSFSPPISVPNPPRDVKASGIQTHSITYTWNPPDNTLSPSYYVTLISSFWGQNLSYPINATSYTFTGLKSGTNYSFEVSTVAGKLQSPPVGCATYTGKTFWPKKEKLFTACTLTVTDVFPAWVRVSVCEIALKTESAIFLHFDGFLFYFNITE